MRKHGGTPSRLDKHVMLAAISPPGVAQGRFVGGHQSGLAGCRPPPLFMRRASSCSSQRQRQREPWGTSPRPSAPTYLPTASCAVLCRAVGCCCVLCRVFGRVVPLRCSCCGLLSRLGLGCRVLCCVPLYSAAPLCFASCCAVVRLVAFSGPVWCRRLLCCALGHCLSPWGVVPSGAVFCRVSLRSVLCVVCVLPWCVGACCCSLLCFELCVSRGVVSCVHCSLRAVRCCAALCWCACVVLLIWSVLFLAPGAVVQCCVLCCFLWCSAVRCCPALLGAWCPVLLRAVLCSLASRPLVRCCVVLCWRACVVPLSSALLPLLSWSVSCGAACSF